MICCICQDAYAYCAWHRTMSRVLYLSRSTRGIKDRWVVGAGRYFSVNVYYLRYSSFLMNDTNDKEASTTVVGVPNSFKDGYSASMIQENEASSEKGAEVTPEATIVDSKAQEDEEWESDPDNARNWPLYRKWVTTAIVCSYPFFGINRGLSNFLYRCRSIHLSLLLPAL